MTGAWDRLIPKTQLASVRTPTFEECMEQAREIASAWVARPDVETSITFTGAAMEALVTAVADALAGRGGAAASDEEPRCAFAWCGSIERAICHQPDAVTYHKFVAARGEGE